MIEAIIKVCTQKSSQLYLGVGWEPRKTLEMSGYLTEVLKDSSLGKISGNAPSRDILMAY